MVIDKGEWVKGLAEWSDGDTAYLSVAFTWRLPEAKARAVWLKNAGFAVRVGGPALFTHKHFLDGVADVGGDYPDAIAHHNPQATFASLGCPQGCWFCIVPKMEGREFTFIPDFPVRPILCDNNLSSLPVEYQVHIVKRYLSAGVPILDASSGFEPATFDEETFARWKPIMRGPWRFGFDEASEGHHVERALRVLSSVGARRKQVYTMIGHEPFDVCMDRIQHVIAWGAEPYVQPFIKLNALEKKPVIRHDWSELRLKQVQRWCNRHLWRSVRFEDYDANVKTSRNNAGKRANP